MRNSMSFDVTIVDYRLYLVLDHYETVIQFKKKKNKEKKNK